MGYNAKIANVIHNGEIIGRFYGLRYQETRLRFAICSRIQTKYGRDYLPKNSTVSLVFHATDVYQAGHEKVRAEIA